MTLKLFLSFFVRLDPFPNGFGFLDVRFGVFDATVAVALADFLPLLMDVEYESRHAFYPS